MEVNGHGGSFGLLEAAGIAAVRLEPQSLTVVRATPALQRMIGQAAVGAAAEDFIEWICPHEKIAFCRGIERLTDGDGEPVTTAMHLRHASGEHVRVHGTVAAVVGDPGDGSPARTFLDVVLHPTPGAAPSKDASRDPDLLRQVIDSIPSLIFVKDWDGRFLLVNEAVAVAYGTTVDALVGKTDADFNANRAEVEQFRADDREVMQSRLAKVVDSERLTRADGSPQWLRTIKVPLLDPEGVSRGVVGVALDVTELRRAEHIAEINKRRLLHALQNSPVVVSEQDLDLRYTWVHNPARAFENVTLVGKTDAEFIDSGAEEILALKRRVLATETGETAEVEIFVAGAPMYWSLYVAPNYDLDGKLCGVSTVGIDFTARRQVELALQASEARMRFTLQAARLMAYEWDIESDTVRVYGFDRFGTPVHDEDGTWRSIGTLDHALSWRPELDRRDVHDALMQAVHGTGEFEWEGRVEGRNGKGDMWVYERGRVQRDERGRPMRLYGIAVDITERHLFEGELQRRRTQLQRMLEASPIGIAFVLHDGTVKECNDAFLSIVAMSREELDANGMNWREYLMVEDKEYDTFVLRPRELLVHRTDGTDVLTLTSYVDLNQGMDECVLFMTDITERTRMEAELRELNERLEQEVAERTNAAARLREMALKVTEAENIERRRLAQTLHDHFQQLLVAAKFSLAGVTRRQPNGVSDPAIVQTRQLVDEAIQASRNLSVELYPPVLFEAGLGEALRWLGQRYGDLQNLKVSVQATSQPVDASEDIQVYLYQAANELLLNVVKHSGSDRAWVTLFDDDPENLRLVVKDRGAGCDAAAMRQQLDQTTGFGLFQIQQRIALFGGHVDIEAMPGNGCRVELIVPRHVRNGNRAGGRHPSTIQSGDWASEANDRRP